MFEGQGRCHVRDTPTTFRGLHKSEAKHQVFIYREKWVQRKRKGVQEKTADRDHVKSRFNEL
jgi:hypothetical protein